MIQHANDPEARRAGRPASPAAPGITTPRRSGRNWPFLSPQVPRTGTPAVPQARGGSGS